MLRPLAVACLAVLAPAAVGELTPSAQFDPAIGSPVAVAWDESDGSVWTCAAFGNEIRHYSSGGTFLGSIPQPGEPADDFDLDVVTEDFVLDGIALPAGTLLAINGELGTADVYALDPATGGLLAVLGTAFGESHVVGGAWHPGRNTLFLVQDRQPASVSQRSVVAEIDPATGAVLGSFKTDVVLPGFTVNYGDLEVATASGTLFVVSSDEATVAEFTPAGALVQQLALPAGVTSPSGIGFEDVSGCARIASSSGPIHRVCGFGWHDLLFGLPGVNGVPRLTGTGSLLPGAATTLAVQEARPDGSTTLVVGLTLLAAPYKGGVLHPSLDVLLTGLPLDGAGSFTLPFAWPAGLPSGFSLHYQAWTPDPAAVQGLSATNGLRSVTP